MSVAPHATLLPLLLLLLSSFSLSEWPARAMLVLLHATLLLLLLLLLPFSLYEWLAGSEMPVLLHASPLLSLLSCCCCRRSACCGVSLEKLKGLAVRPAVLEPRGGNS
jgi:hypothetical protein